MIEHDVSQALRERPGEVVSIEELVEITGLKAQQISDSVYRLLRRDYWKDRLQVVVPRHQYRFDEPGQLSFDDLDLLVECDRLHAHVMYQTTDGKMLVEIGSKVYRAEEFTL